MRTRRRLIAGLLLASASVLAACGSDAPSAPASSPAAGTSPAPSSASSVSASASAPSKVIESVPVSSATPGPQQCAQQRDITVKIVLGDIDCAAAYDVAFRVDLDGDKRQDVDGHVCELGNATIRPTIFSCTDNANGAEFSVDET